MLLTLCGYTAVFMLRLSSSLPTAKPRIQSPVTSCEFDGVRNATGPGFTQFLVSLSFHHYAILIYHRPLAYGIALTRQRVITFLVCKLRVSFLIQLVTELGSFWDTYNWRDAKLKTSSGGYKKIYPRLEFHSGPKGRNVGSWKEWTQIISYSSV
jgi:hypothetical protein